MWHFRTWFSRHGGVGWMVGLDGLRGLFQPEWFYDSILWDLYWVFLNWYSWAHACSKSASIYPQVFPFDVSLVFKIKISLIAKNILCKKLSAICEKPLDFSNLHCGHPASPRPGLLCDHLALWKTLPSKEVMDTGSAF